MHSSGKLLLKRKLYTAVIERIKQEERKDVGFDTIIKNDRNSSYWRCEVYVTIESDSWNDNTSCRWSCSSFNVEIEFKQTECNYHNKERHGGNVNKYSVYKMPRVKSSWFPVEMMVGQFFY